jgi:hypothetical protein
VDVRKGHKTGFYLDQRDARAAVARCANGAEMLNCFAYTGGFGLAARAAGAEIVIVMPHWGIKNRTDVPESVRTLAVQMAQAGARMAQAGARMAQAGFQGLCLRHGSAQNGDSWRRHRHQN